MYRWAEQFPLPRARSAPGSQLQGSNPEGKMVQFCSTSGCPVAVPPHPHLLPGWALQHPVAEAGLAVVSEVILPISLFVICN